MKKISTLIKKNKTLFNFLVYLYYLGWRILGLLTEGKKRKKYFLQIEGIKRNKKIVVDCAFFGIGDLLVWSQIPELLKKQYDIDFFISKRTRDSISNQNVFDLIFGLNPYFKGVCNNDTSFRVDFFYKDMTPFQLLTDKGGVSIIEMLERQFDLQGTGLPKIYYKPKLIAKYKDLILIDKNMISGSKFDWKFHEKSFEIEAFKRGGQGALEYVDTQKQDLFTYVDMIYSCKYFVCTFSGSASIAACLNKPYSVIWPYNAINRTNYQFRYSNSLGCYVK